MPTKPLGARAYSSIGHLPGSRLGPGDHHVHEGQARICTERRARDKHDRIWVQEKLDGSCVAAARIEGRIVPLIRAGYDANDSPREQHQMFAAWVASNEKRFREVLVMDGERLCGEWLAEAHGTRYALEHEPFVAFDLITGAANRAERATLPQMLERVAAGAFQVPRLLAVGATSIEDVQRRIRVSGHGALDPVEGAVWRVERMGVVDFLAKWVRPDKADGAYLSDVSGQPAVWNWRPEAA